MRRFSQRSHLVTLSEINITPLLDLAFVLLIIFVITTPLLENGLALRLPKVGGKPDTPVNPRDIRTVEISTQGVYMLNRQRMTLAQVESQLVRDFKANPALVIYVRADENSQMKYYVALTDACTRNGISRFSIRTDPSTTR